MKDSATLETVSNGYGNAKETVSSWVLFPTKKRINKKKNQFGNSGNSLSTIDKKYSKTHVKRRPRIHIRARLFHVSTQKNRKEQQT